MASEELIQRGYIDSGKLKGNAFGVYEELNIGATTLQDLRLSGLDCTIASKVSYPFREYKATKNPHLAKPDRVIIDRRKGTPVSVAIIEQKPPSKFNTEKKVLVASEQALFYAAVLGIRVAVATDGKKAVYIDVDESINTGALVRFPETRHLNPGVLEDLLVDSSGVAKNPTQLAQTIWQMIWHATKEEPKQCLLTFVELFILKFLSDNLAPSDLPKAKSFYELVDKSSAEFEATHGKSELEYYVQDIRPHIKTLFPETTVVPDVDLPSMFGMTTLVSRASIINGFAFLRSSANYPLKSFNRTFLEILQAFNNFGSLSKIDPEFKFRLYETFLRNTPRQQSLGQFFTPRNVVREMVRMAQLSKLPDGATLLDPAAGVGGFILEPLLIEDALVENVTITAGAPKQRVRTVGLDMDINTHILAKANMLLHLSELLKEPTTTIPAMNKALANTFVLMNANETLGSLEYPPQNSVDVVLANPPYVTQGSAIYRKEIADMADTRNGLILKDFYDGWGLGVESLFIRYISSSLKPGRRAFVIVPLGMLNRTEKKPKQKILSECDLLASITLPRNTFFNTAQLTCILVLEKRHTQFDPRPNVLCACVRSIGETLDTYRAPMPDDNDLAAVASAFIQRTDDPTFLPSDPFIKVVPAERFTENDRWDVARFWTEEELVTLGIKAAAIGRVEFIDEAIGNLNKLSEELEASKEEIFGLTAQTTVSINLSNVDLFRVRSGTRITNTQVRDNPGEVPVYSCSKYRDFKKGDISEEWLVTNGIRMETGNRRIVTIAANGSVGAVFTRNEKCVLTDDLIAVEVLVEDIDVEYLATELRRKIAAGGFLYEAKLFKGRVEQLAADIPIKEDGTYDLDTQREIAAATRRFDTIRDKLKELGAWSEEARIS